MKTIVSQCDVCRRKIDDERSDLWGGAWDLSICEACCRQRMLKDGGLSIRFERQPRDAAFDIGEVQVKPGAIHYLIESREHCWPFIEQHARTAKPADTHATRLHFFESGGNLISEHQTKLGKRLWLMTEPSGFTVMMAPGEF